MTDQGPAVLCLGSGQVLLRGPAVVDVWRLAAVGARVTEQRDGIARPARVSALLAALEAEARTAMSANGHADVRDEADEAPCAVYDHIDTREAATLVGVSERQLRRVAGELGGRRCGRGWLFDRAQVIAYVATKKSG